MPTSPSKTLILSLHDVHPSSCALIEEQLNSLKAWGVSQASLLIVPEFHHKETWNISDLARCSQWQREGHELVLHGYFHDRQGQQDSLQHLFWTHFYTNHEAEFLNLHHEQAKERLEQGRSFFTAQKWPLHGFIAPAWLMAPFLPSLLQSLGFSYTNRLTELLFWPSHSENSPVALPCQSLCYSTRALWRCQASLFWNRWLFNRQCQQQVPLIRLSLHPKDLTFPRLRAQIQWIIESALKAGYTPTTYAQYVRYAIA